MEKQFTYTVTSDIHHGRLFKAGAPITLTETEAAGLSGYLDLSSQRDADPSAQPGKALAETEAAAEKVAGQVEKLTAENKELKDKLAKAKGAQKAIA